MSQEFESRSLNRYPFWQICLEWLKHERGNAKKFLMTHWVYNLSGQKLSAAENSFVPTAIIWNTFYDNKSSFLPCRRYTNPVYRMYVNLTRYYWVMQKSKWPHISFYWLTNHLKKYYATFYETIKGDFDHSAQQISKNEKLLSHINFQFTGRPDWPHKTQWTCLLW